METCELECVEWSVPAILKDEAERMYEESEDLICALSRIAVSDFFR